jgi:hypothetical protein
MELCFSLYVIFFCLVSLQFVKFLCYIGLFTFHSQQINSTNRCGIKNAKGNEISKRARNKFKKKLYSGAVYTVSIVNEDPCFHQLRSMIRGSNSPISTV